MDLHFDLVKFFHDNNLYNNYGGWQAVVIEQFIPELLKIIQLPAKMRHYIFLGLDKKMSLELANNVINYINTFGYDNTQLTKVGDEGYVIQVTIDFSK